MVVVVHLETSNSALLLEQRQQQHRQALMNDICGQVRECVCVFVCVFQSDNCWYTR